MRVELIYNILQIFILPSDSFANNYQVPSDEIESSFLAPKASALPS